MYTSHNFKTKKQLRETFEAGKVIHVYQAGPFGMDAERGVVGQVRTCYLEGPHEPQPHTWYAMGEYEVCSMQMVTFKGSRAKWVNGVFAPAPVKQAIVKPENIIEVPPVEAIESAEGMTCEGHFGISRDHAKPKSTIVVPPAEGRDDQVDNADWNVKPLSLEDAVARLVAEAEEARQIGLEFERQGQRDRADYWYSRRHGIAMALGYLAGVQPYAIIGREDFEEAAKRAVASVRG